MVVARCRRRADAAEVATRPGARMPTITTRGSNRSRSARSGRGGSEKREAEEKERERKKQDEEERKRREENERRQKEAQQRKEREDRERKEREAESERRKREEEAAKQKAAASQAQQETAAKKKDSVGKLNSHRFAFLDADSPDALFGDIDSAAPSAAPVRSASPEAKRDVSPRDVQPADSGNAEPLAAKSRRGPRPVSSGGATPVSVNKDETPAAKPERSKLSQERFAFLGGEVDTKEAADVDSPVVEPAKGILKERPRSQPAGKRVSFYQNSAGEEEDVDDERDAAEEQEARRNLEKQKREEEERRERETVEKQEKERRDKERRDKLREERVAKAGGAEEKKGGSLRINNEKCHVCAKTVYFNERLSAEGVIFHNACFRVRPSSIFVFSRTLGLASADVIDLAIAAVQPLQR